MSLKQFIYKFQHHIPEIDKRGLKLPLIGMGGFGQKKEAIQEAINLGYRLIDTASQYGNEREVGEAIINSGVSRDRLIVQTKLWTVDIRNGDVETALDSSLSALKTEYVDVYLLHYPTDGYEAAWEKMIRMKEKGKTHYIGVCNFDICHLKNLESISYEKPFVQQIESHPYFRNHDLVQYCLQNDILVEAWAPLGGEFGHVLEDETIRAIADKYDKTPAQIVLRWHIQRGLIVIPKSNHVNRMKQNIELFDFELDNEDMLLINSLDTEVRMGPDPNNIDF